MIDIDIDIQVVVKIRVSVVGLPFLLIFSTKPLGEATTPCPPLRTPLRNV